VAASVSPTASSPVKPEYLLANAAGRARIWWIVAAVGAALCLWGVISDHRQFHFSYLVAFAFWTTIALGGLFFLMIHHLTGSVWSIVVRRFFEAVAKNLYLMAFLFIPVLVGAHELYHWSHPEAVATDTILQKKAGYLNVPFWTIRAALYFAIWSLLVWRLTALSERQDRGEAVSGSFAKIAAPGMILFAFSATFAAFDWLMALDPHWYSTIYGVYIVMGGIMAMFALVVRMVNAARRQGALQGAVTAEHYHDLGKLLFAFMIMWAYMAFSQYFLIWYANLPEETIFYRHRWIGGWKAISLLLPLGHFAVPFFLLINRPAKRNPAFLGTIALGLLAMHWIDLYWNVIPILHPKGATFSYLDGATMLFTGGLFMAFLWKRLGARPLVPVNDPRLEDSLKFVNK